MDTAQVEPISDFAREGARRARGWVLPLTLWVAAVVLGSALIWIVPRASASHEVSTRNASLSSSVASERSAAATAAAVLTADRSQVVDAQQHLKTLRGADKHRTREITRLQAQVKKLRAENARLTALPALPGGSGIKVGGPIRTPVFCIEFPTNPPPGCL